MAYIAPKDFSQDPELFAKVMKVMQGDLDLGWMKRLGEPAAYRPSQSERGLTLDDINHGAYSPDRIPEVIRHNFSMAPRGAILPRGLPSLGYRLNRKSEVWADNAAELFEEGKSRRWAPARDVPWEALDMERKHDDRVEHAIRQLSTSLISIGLVANDVAAYWEWRMNQEFHEVKYLLCVQMFDACRIAEAFRKRALYGDGALGVDSPALGQLLKAIFESDTYPQASVAMNVTLFSWVQALGRHLEFTSTNAADTCLGTRLTQDTSRFIAYGVAQARTLVTERPLESELLNEHLDLIENVLVGALGAPEIIEPLVLISGGLDPVVRLYERTTHEYLARCHAAGLGERSSRSPLPGFVELLGDKE
jgi:hypothetical protein